MLYVQNMYKILMAIAFPWSPPFLKGPCPFSRVCFLFFSRVIIPFQGSLSFSKDSFLFQGPEPSRKLHVKEDQQAVAQLWLCHCQLAFVDMQLPRLSMPFQGCGNVLGKALTQHGLDKAKQGSCCMYCFFLPNEWGGANRINIFLSMKPYILQEKLFRTLLLGTSAGKGLSVQQFV